jgi:hypothetical protein
MLDYIRDERATSYSTGIDFCKIFTDEMNNLYLLAFLLTADSDKAEKCFVNGLAESVEGPGGFLEWARSKARRTILKQAIRMIKPAPEDVDYLAPVSCTAMSTLAQYNPAGAIVALGTFERFVFVMSVLEKQSDEDCSALLNCSQRELMIARELAFISLIPTGNSYDRPGQMRVEA